MKGKFLVGLVTGKFLVYLIRGKNYLYIEGRKEGESVLNIMKSEWNDKKLNDVS